MGKKVNDVCIWVRRLYRQRLTDDTRLCNGQSQISFAAQMVTIPFTAFTIIFWPDSNPICCSQLPLMRMNGTVLLLQRVLRLSSETVNILYWPLLLLFFCCLFMMIKTRRWYHHQWSIELTGLAPALRRVILFTESRLLKNFKNDGNVNL